MSGPFVKPKASKVNGVKIPHVVAESSAMTVIIDDVSTYQYFGKASIGSSAASPVWQISRLTVANPQTLLWADGDALFDNVWDNRSSLSYT